jgi:hypothetical protein
VNFRPSLKLLPFCAALAACGGGSTDLDDATGGTAIIAVTALSEETSAGFEVEEAWVSLDELRLVPCTDDVGSIGLGDFPVSLLHEPPPQAIFGTGVLDYCTVHLELGPSDSETALDGLSALVRGTRGDGVEVVIESVVTTAIDVSGPSFNVSSVVLGFDLTTWLAGVDVDAAELDDTGVARIDSTHNPELLAEFEAGLLTAPSLYRDYDGDSHVGEDELTPVATPE